MFELFRRRKTETATAANAQNRLEREREVSEQPYVAETMPGRTAEQAGAARAEFARQVTGFVNLGNPDHALELVKYAIIAEEGKDQTAEVKDELLFLRELQGHVLGIKGKGDSASTENQ